MFKLFQFLIQTTFLISAFEQECRITIYLGMTRNESTIYLFENERLQAASNYLFVKKEEMTDIESYIQENTKLTFKSMIDFQAQKNPCRIYYFEAIGYICSFFNQSYVMLQGLTFNSEDNDFQISTSEMQYFDITKFQYEDCPELVYLNHTNFFLYCFNSKIHEILLSSEQGTLTSIFQSPLDSCEYHFGIFDSNYYAYVTKCKNWKIYEFNQSTKTFGDLCQNFIFEDTILQNIKFEQYFMFLIFPNTVLQVLPYECLIINNIQTEEQIIDFKFRNYKGKHLWILESRNETFYNINETYFIGKQEKYIQLVMSQDTQVMIFKNKISLIYNQVLIKQYFIDIQSAFHLKNNPYIMLVTKNNSLIVYELEVPFDNLLLIENHKNQQVLLFQTNTEKYRKYFIYNIEIINEADNFIQSYYQQYPKNIIFNSQAYNLDLQYFSGAPCQISIQDNLVKQIEQSQEICMDRNFNTSKIFFSHITYSGILMIFQEGKHNQIIENVCNNSQIVYFVYLEYEISFNTFFYHDNENLVVVRDNYYVIVLKINFFHTIDKIKQFTIQNIDQVFFMQDFLYFITKNQTYVLNLLDQRIVPYKLHRCCCKLLMISLFFNVYNCEKKLLLSANNIEYFFTLPNNTIEVQIVEPQHLIIFELTVEKKIIGKIYKIKFPKIVFIYNIPLYSYEIFYPINSQKYPNLSFQSLLVKKDNQLFILLYNFQRTARNSLQQIIKCDSKYFSNALYIFNDKLFLQLLTLVKVQFEKQQLKQYSIMHNVLCKCSSMINNHSISFNIPFIFMYNTSQLRLNNEMNLHGVSLDKFVLGPIENIQLTGTEQFQIDNPLVFKEKAYECNSFTNNICRIGRRLLIFTAESHVEFDENYFNFSENYFLYFDIDSNQIFFSKVHQNFELHLYQISTKILTSYYQFKDSSDKILNSFSIIIEQFLFYLDEYNNRFQIYQLTNEKIMFLQEIQIINRIDNFDVIKLKISEEKLVFTIQVKVFLVQLCNIQVIQSEDQCYEFYFDDVPQIKLYQLNHQFAPEQQIKAIQLNDDTYSIIILYQNIGYVFSLHMNGTNLQNNLSFQLIGMINYPYELTNPTIISFSQTYVFLRFENSQHTYIYSLQLCNNQTIYLLDSIYSIKFEKITRIDDHTFTLSEQFYDLQEGKSGVLVKKIELQNWKLKCLKEECSNQWINLTVINNISNITFPYLFWHNQEEQDSYSVLPSIILINFIVIASIMFMKKKKKSMQRVNIS